MSHAVTEKRQALALVALRGCSRRRRGRRPVTADGHIDPAKFAAQGHRGGRDRRSETTLPALEAGLDDLVTTLETDINITRDLKTVLSHDPHILSQKCRRADGASLR